MFLRMFWTKNGRLAYMNISTPGASSPAASRMGERTATAMAPSAGMELGGLNRGWAARGPAGRWWFLRLARVSLDRRSGRQTRNRPLGTFSFVSAQLPISTKVGSSIHRVRPASGFLLVAQSKATRRGGLFQNSGCIPPRRSRLGTNDKEELFTETPQCH